MHRRWMVRLFMIMLMIGIAVLAVQNVVLAEKEEVVTTASGLQYVELVPGTGGEAQVGQTAVVHYTGWLKDGTKFDSSKDRNQPFRFPLGGGRVIKGWDEGVVGMKIGGTRKLIIPPHLGYGASRCRTSHSSQCGPHF